MGNPAPRTPARTACRWQVLTISFVRGIDEKVFHSGLHLYHIPERSDNVEDLVFQLLVCQLSFLERGHKFTFRPRAEQPKVHSSPFLTNVCTSRCYPGLATCSSKIFTVYLFSMPSCLSFL